MKLKKTTFKNKKNAPNITRNNLFDYPTVKGLIKDLEVKKEQGILEKPNFDFLIKLIKKAQSENEIVNICTLGTGYYKTTLKFSPKLEVETSKIHYFCKNKSLSFKQPKGENNKLIIGDNYHALQNLLISYRSKIDVIYIDPPYGCNSMGEGAKTNYGNEHLNRNHLLSSLKPRLTLAKQLLSSSGLIFCSIDDSNQAYIKCLFDDIFEKKNFLCNFVWVKKHGPGGNTTFKNKIVINTEYILAYCKNIDNISINNNIHNEEKLKELGYVNKDKYFNERGFYKLTPLYHPSSTGSFQYTKSLDYKIKAPTGEMFSLHCNKGGKKRGCYTWGYKTYLEGDKLGFIECKKNDDGDWIAYRKQYQFVKFNPKNLKVERILAGSQYENIIDDFYSAEGGKDFVNVMKDKNLFTFPKPVNLIKYIVGLTSNSNAICLDFYAGSGTTGQAVLELNKEDNGKRKFILCNNNENNIAYGITYERLKRVMTGKATDNSKFDWIKSNKPLDGSLDVIEIKETSKFDPKSITKIDETIYDLEKHKTINEHIDWVCSNFKITTNKIEE